MKLLSELQTHHSVLCLTWTHMDMDCTLANAECFSVESPVAFPSLKEEKELKKIQLREMLEMYRFV